MIQLTLPLPSFKLSPNQTKGKNWRSLNAIINQEKITMGILINEQLKKGKFSGFTTKDKLQYILKFYRPTNASVDIDNLVASTKYTTDILMKRLGINDNQIIQLVAYKDVDQLEPRLEITLATLDNC